MTKHITRRNTNVIIKNEPTKINWSLFDFIPNSKNNSRKKRNIQKASKDAMNINTIKLNSLQLIIFI